MSGIYIYIIFYCITFFEKLFGHQSWTLSKRLNSQLFLIHNPPLSSFFVRIMGNFNSNRMSHEKFETDKNDRFLVRIISDKIARIAQVFLSIPTRNVILFLYD